MVQVHLVRVVRPIAVNVQVAVIQWAQTVAIKPFIFKLIRSELEFRCYMTARAWSI